MPQKRLPIWRQLSFKNGLPFFFFLPKSSKFCIFRIFRYCSNITSMWSKSTKKCMERLFHSNVRSEYHVAVNLPLNSWVLPFQMLQLKSLYSLFDTYLDHMHSRYELNRMIRNVQNLQFFDKK